MVNILKNKNVLITGATGGVGRELCSQFIEQGSNLFITSKDIDDYYATKEECFKVAIERADFARATPQIFFALPMCQEIILGEKI